MSAENGLKTTSILEDARAGAAEAEAAPRRGRRSSGYLHAGAFLFGVLLLVFLVRMVGLDMIFEALARLHARPGGGFSAGVAARPLTSSQHTSELLACVFVPNRPAENNSGIAISY